MCGGGGYVKNYGRIASDIASSETSSPEIPQKTKLKLIKKYLFFTASALILRASLGLAQSVKAEGTLTVADINSARPGDPKAVNSKQPIQSPRQFADEGAVSALSAFAQQIGAANSKPAGIASVNTERQFDDQAFGTLQDFAQWLGGAQPESIKALPKLAEADTILDLLKGSSPQTPPADKPDKGPVAGGKNSTVPVDAHAVGDKVCLTCHASQTAEFQKTLMGRIGKTE